VDSGDHDADANCLSYVDMEYDFPKYPTIAEVEPLTAMEREMWLDITPYMNQVRRRMHEGMRMRRRA
jgi:hypothetical protein